MSFGRPPSISTGFQVTPPDRGSFPLDHYGLCTNEATTREGLLTCILGECRDQMMAYANCLRNNANSSTPCRHLNKAYLECRMNKGLMQRDEWKNLGLSNVDKETKPTKDPAQGTSTS
ncbi:hypothetical protein OE88DRAFT_1651384, partial [Heliocybe sulcata]